MLNRSIGNTTYYGSAAGADGYNLANQPLMTVFPATGQTGSGGAGMTETYLYPGGPLLATRSYDESGGLARTEAFLTACFITPASAACGVYWSHNQSARLCLPSIPPMRDTVMGSIFLTSYRAA